MLSRTPGHGRYAVTEREQRWLLGELPLERRAPVEITDHYLNGTCLRLRKMTSPDATIYKLGQKVRALGDSPEIVKATNIYLEEQEYSTFSSLSADQLHKTRWTWEFSGRSLAADEFHGNLEGLILAEVELEVSEDFLTTPPSATADVTADNRFSGGALAALDRLKAIELLQVVNSWGRR